MTQTWRARHAPRPATTFWQRHHRKLNWLALFCFVHDFVVGISGAWILLLQGGFEISACFMTMIQLIVHVIFVRTSREYTAPIRAYFQFRQQSISSIATENGERDSDHRFGQLLFWLTISSFFMGINTLVNGAMFMSFATYWLGINTISYELVQRLYIPLQFLYVIGSTSSRVLIASTVRPKRLLWTCSNKCVCARKHAHAHTYAHNYAPNSK